MKHKSLVIKNQKVIEPSATNQNKANGALNLSLGGKPRKGELRISNKAKNGQRKKPRNKKKLLTILFISFAVLGALTAALIYFIVIPAKKVYDSAENIKTNLYSILSDIQQKDISNLEDHLNNVKDEISKINSEIDKFDFLENLEQTKGYYENFEQAQVILTKTDKLITETLPELKNVLQISGFKVEKDVENTDNEEGAITLILKEMPQYLRLYDEIEPKIIDIFKEVKKINPDYLPQFLGFDIKDNLKEFNKFADDFPEISKKTVNFVKEMPQLLGSEGGPTTYLLILQNETEMRASGGLLTAFGTVKVEDGEIIDELDFIDTWQIQYDMWRIADFTGLPMPRNNIYGQAYLMNHNCGATEARVQDVGLYPDLNITIEYFREYYDRVMFYYPQKYEDYDNVIIMNYKFSENLLKLIEPVEVEGFGEVNAENLYEFIKNETDNPNNFYSEDRKEIIGKIGDVIKEKLFGLGLERISDLLKFFVSSMQAKDLAFSSKNDDLQDYFDTYGMSGRSAQEFDGDYFQFNEAQNCSLKLNKFIRDNVEISVNIDDDGSISNSAKVKWQQTQVYNDSLKLQYSPTLQWSYRAWLRFILPPDSKNIVSDGYGRSRYLYYFPRTYFDDELNKEVSDNIIQFDHRRFTESDPIERDEININWDLPENINYLNAGRYKLLIQKHPGKSWGEHYKIYINHAGETQTVEFILDRDKVISYKDGIITLDNYDKGMDWILTLSNKIPWNEIGSSD